MRTTELFETKARPFLYAVLHPLTSETCSDLGFGALATAVRASMDEVRVAQMQCDYDIQQHNDWYRQHQQQRQQEQGT